MVSNDIIKLHQKLSVGDCLQNGLRDIILWRTISQNLVLLIFIHLQYWLANDTIVSRSTSAYVYLPHQVEICMPYTSI